MPTSKLKFTTIKTKDSIKINMKYFGNIDKNNVDFLDPDIHEHFDVQIMTDNVDENWGKQISQKI